MRVLRLGPAKGLRLGNRTYTHTGIDSASHPRSRQQGLRLGSRTSGQPLAQLTHSITASHPPRRVGDIEVGRKRLLTVAAAAGTSSPPRLPAAITQRTRPAPKATGLGIRRAIRWRTRAGHRHKNRARRLGTVTAAGVRID